MCAIDFDSLVLYRCLNWLPIIAAEAEVPLELVKASLARLRKECLHRRLYVRVLTRVTARILIVFVAFYQ